MLPDLKPPQDVKPPGFFMDRFQGNPVTTWTGIIIAVANSARELAFTPDGRITLPSLIISVSSLILGIFGKDK